MKKAGVIAILLICVPLFAQQWHLMPNAIKDSVNILNEVYFVNKDTGIIIARNSSNANAIFRSIDGGKTWIKSWQAGNNSQQNIDLTGNLQFYGKDTGWVGCTYSFSLSETSHFQQGGFLRTIDAGKSWNMLPMPIVANNGDTIGSGNNIFSFPNSLVGWFTYSHVTARNGNTLVGYFHLFKTTDGGISWVEQTDIDTNGLSTNHFFYFSNINCIDTLNGFIMGDSGCYRTKDGHHWIGSRVNWPFLNRLNIAARFNGERGYIIADFYDAYLTNDLGVTWSKMAFPKYAHSHGNLMGSFINDSVGWCLFAGSDTCVNINIFGYPCNCVPNCKVNCCHICYDTSCFEKMIGILKTTNSGKDWSRDLFMRQFSDYFDLNDLFMLNDSTGWAVGANGAVAMYSKSNSMAISSPKNKSEILPILHSRLDANSLIFLSSLPVKGNLLLYDLQGKIVWLKQDYCLLKGENRFPMMPHKIKPGCYVFMFEISGKKSTASLFLMK